MIPTNHNYPTLTRGRTGGRIERVQASSGLFFPGTIATPPEARTDSEKEARDKAAIEEGKRWNEDPNTLWIDGSALPSGVAAAAVVGYVVPHLGEDAPNWRTIRSGGCPELRPEFKSAGRSRRKGVTYGLGTRSILVTDQEGGFRSEAWSLGAQSSAFDAEVQGLVRAIEIAAMDAREGEHFRIFTDSLAAMKRIESDRPGPGQLLAIRGITIARLGIYDRGASVSIGWVPGHHGVPGNELADLCARDEAARAERLRTAREEREDIARAREGNISMAFIKGRARKEANRVWAEMVKTKNRERGYVTIRRTEGQIPRIPEALRRAPKHLASRFFQLASGHAMTAPFLRDKLKWTDSDICWWCSEGRQTREHLFKECSTWKEEIRTLWKEVGEATTEGISWRRKSRYKGAKGFGISVGTGGGQRSRGPGNTSIGTLFADERCIPAILSFLASTRCGQVKEGVIERGGGP